VAVGEAAPLPHALALAAPEADTVAADAVLVCVREGGCVPAEELLGSATDAVGVAGCVREVVCSGERESEGEVVAERAPDAERERAALPLALGERAPLRVALGVGENESVPWGEGLPAVLPLGEGDGLGEAVPVAERSGVREAEGEPVALAEARGEALARALRVGTKEGEGAAEGEPVRDGARDALAPSLREGVPLRVAHALRDAEGECVTLRVPARLAAALRDAEGDTDAEPEVDRELEGERLPLLLGDRVSASGVRDAAAEGLPVGDAAAERVAEGASRTLIKLGCEGAPPCATARNSASGAPAGSGSAPSGAKKPPSSAAASQGSSPEEGVTEKRLASAPGPQWPLPSRSEKAARAGPSIAPRSAPSGAPASASCAVVRPPDGSLRPTAKGAAKVAPCSTRSARGTSAGAAATQSPLAADTRPGSPPAVVHGGALNSDAAGGGCARGAGENARRRNSHRVIAARKLKRVVTSMQE